MNDIKETIKSVGFQELWFVKKDEIIECKKCALRYMCIDTRVPKKRNGQWSFEDNCFYYNSN